MGVGVDRGNFEANNQRFPAWTGRRERSGWARPVWEGGPVLGPVWARCRPGGSPKPDLPFQTGLAPSASPPAMSLAPNWEAGGTPSLLSSEEVGRAMEPTVPLPPEDVSSEEDAVALLPATQEGA